MVHLTLSNKEGGKCAILFSEIKFDEFNNGVDIRLAQLVTAGAKDSKQAQLGHQHLSFVA